jgi:hypothetical protein
MRDLLAKTTAESHTKPPESRRGLSVTLQRPAAPTRRLLKLTCTFTKYSMSKGQPERAPGRQGMANS